MRKENLFYMILVLTIIIQRILVILVPEVDIILFNSVIHHFWIGLFLLIIGFLIPKHKSFLKLLLYGIGAGLVVDQLVFIILGSGGEREYWAFPSLLSAIILSLLVFPIRKKVTNFLLNVSLKIC